MHTPWLDHVQLLACRTCSPRPFPHLCWDLCCKLSRMMPHKQALSRHTFAGGCDSLSCSIHPVQVTQKPMPNFPVAKRPKKSSRSRGACPVSVIPDTEKVGRACCWGTPNDAIKKRLDFHAFEDAVADHGALEGLTAGLPTPTASHTCCAREHCA